MNAPATFTKHITVDEVTGCHVWTASRDVWGYGHYRVGRKVARAHRVAWEAVHGPIPPGLVVCHRCDNPSCVNVDHLFIGTHADNQHDKCRKGRQARGERNGRSASPDRPAHRRDRRGARSTRAGDLTDDRSACCG